jgi:predicted phosphodiesterase
LARNVAIISDIHGNLEALTAVLSDISAQGIDEIWCLGDIVGYGPDPEACVDLVMKNCSVCVMGNHDWALLNRPVGFNDAAAAMIYLTQRRMRPGPDSSEEVRRRWEFIEGLPPSYKVDDVLLVHASPRDELTEYLLPYDVDYDVEKLEDVFSLVGHVCFVGHSHIPCVFTSPREVLTPSEAQRDFEIGEGKLLVNEGSVGQPRDNDSRSCYVTLEDDVVRYRRVAYEHQKTMNKIFALGDEYWSLGYRLAIGR